MPVVRSTLQDAKSEVQKKLGAYFRAQDIVARELRADQAIPETHYEVSLREYKPYFITHTKSEGKFTQQKPDE